MLWFYFVLEVTHTVSPPNLSAALPNFKFSVIMLVAGNQESFTPQKSANAIRTFTPCFRKPAAKHLLAHLTLVSTIMSVLAK